MYIVKCIKPVFQISVRSGGHGYTCTQLKEDSILIDMRGGSWDICSILSSIFQFLFLLGMRKIRLVKTNQSPTGLASVLEAGATWGQVSLILIFLLVLLRFNFRLLHSLLLLHCHPILSSPIISDVCSSHTSHSNLFYQIILRFRLHLSFSYNVTETDFLHGKNLKSNKRN